MIFLWKKIVFFLKHTNSLVQHFDWILQPVSIGKPILLLKLFHISEIQLRYGGWPVLWLWVFILNSLSDCVNRGIHELIKVNCILRNLLLMIIHSLSWKDLLIWRVDYMILRMLYSFLKFRLQFFIFLFLCPQLIVKLDVLSLLFSKLLLYNNDLFFHKPSLLITHALLL
jgi:hypothetical protein